MPDLLSALSRWKEEGGPQHRRTPEAIPPEVERGLYLDFMDQHYQGWVDEAESASQSPSEALYVRCLKQYCCAS